MRRRLLIGVALAALLAGCGGSEQEETFTGVPFEDPGPIHVHGLGLDPQTRTLYIATHTGLWQLPKGQAKETRITDRRQDTMGFTLVRPGLFLGSGHPDLREAKPDLPPLLGLIKSSDNGQTWQQISLLGKADFHVLRSAGSRIYGFDSTHNLLMRSDNGGTSWRKSKVPEPLLDLAIDSADAKHLIASGEVALYESKNAGQVWHLLGTTPGYRLAEREAPLSLRHSRWCSVLRLADQALQTARVGRRCPARDPRHERERDVRRNRWRRDQTLTRRRADLAIALAALAPAVKPFAPHELTCFPRHLVKTAVKYRSGQQTTTLEDRMRVYLDNTIC